MATAKAGFASGLVFTPPLVAQWMPRPVVVDITPASVSGAGVAEETYTVSGATTKDAVFVSPSGITAGAYKFILIKAQE